MSRSWSSGRFTAREGKEEEAVEAFRALVQPTHDEDGCILYALNRGADDPSYLAFVERWSSKEAHDAHMAAPHIQAILGRVDELFGDSASIVRYEEVPRGRRRSVALRARGRLTGRRARRESTGA